MLLLLLLLQLPLFMVLAERSIFDWCYVRSKGVIWEAMTNDLYLSRTVPISNGNIQIEINGQSIAADQKNVTLQYMPPYIDMNITTTNVFEGALKVIKGYGDFMDIRPYQELPSAFLRISGTPIDQPFHLNVLHVVADKQSNTCTVSRLDTIYVTVQHLALPEIGTFEACNICNNDTHHRMWSSENGYIEQFGYKAECPEMQRLALDGRLSEKNCLELGEPILGENGWTGCSCLYSYNKTREEEQKDWKDWKESGGKWNESGGKAFAPGVESVVLLWLITAFLFY